MGITAEQNENRRKLFASVHAAYRKLEPWRQARKEAFRQMIKEQVLKMQNDSEVKPDE